MSSTIKFAKKVCIVLGVIFCLVSAVFGGDQGMAKMSTIGIAMDIESFAPNLEGFKTGMAELGYVEGKNIRYIYYGVVEDDDKIFDAVMKKLISKDVDILVAIGSHSALRAKEVTRGTAMPVLISGFSNDIAGGRIVENLNHPEGNMTGVRMADNMPKAFEWLVKVVPGTKKIYLPYNPVDEVSAPFLPIVNKAADHLGIELVFQKIHSVEETVAAIETLPKNINAIFRIPSVTLDARNSELSRAAIKRGLPMAAGFPMDEAVLLTFGPDLFNSGKQAARLANQILHGIKPADLPVEATEIFLTINLKTAEKIGLHIPDNILLQANKIIR